jgi:hypothetical protein
MAALRERVVDAARRTILTVRRDKAGMFTGIENNLVAQVP